MSSSISTSGNTPLNAAELERLRRISPGASNNARSGTSTVQPATASAATSATGTAGAEQSAEGAQQAQQQQVEVFNAPPISLPPNPSTLEAMDGLVRAMATEGVNETTAQQLYQLHEMLFSAEKSMAQAVIDGVLI